MRFLLIEDDPAGAALLTEALTTQRYLVNTTDDASTALQLLDAYGYDLVILDMPLEAGIALCRRIRAAGQQMPILMLGMSDEQQDRIASLEAGADDYMLNPGRASPSELTSSDPATFDPAELFVRVRALLRRGQDTYEEILSWENLRLNCHTGEVTYQGQMIHLTPKEYGLLELFLRHPNKMFSRAALLDRIWNPGEFPSERAVNTQIKGLRQKLKSADMHVDMIESLYGLGYRLKAAPIETSESAQERSGELAEEFSRESSGLEKVIGSTTVGSTTVDSSAIEAEVLAQIAETWRRFQADLEQQFTLFDEVILQLRSQTLQPELQQKARLFAHQLIGSLGTFGLTTGSSLARQIEQLLSSSLSASLGAEPDLDTDLDAGVLSQDTDASTAQSSTAQSSVVQSLTDYVTALRNAVAAFSQPQNPLTVSTSTLPPAPPIPAGTKILLVDHDQAFTAQIHALLASWEIHTQIVSDRSSAKTAITADQPDLILLDLSLPNDDGFELLAELNSQPSAIPIIAMMSQSQLSDRVAVARLGGHGFLQKPVSPEQLSQAIRQMLRLTQPSAFHILLVDDDPHICTVVKTLLEPWDLSVTCIENPLLFWNVLETCTPSLLILDIEMPHFNGLELCQVVRNDLRWNELPILILSAHNNTDIVRQVFTVGADDYVSKPIVDAELIARVLNRLERSQRYRLK